MTSADVCFALVAQFFTLREWCHGHKPLINHQPHGCRRNALSTRSWLKIHLTLWSCWGLFFALLKQQISWSWFSIDKLCFNQSVFVHFRLTFTTSLRWIWCCPSLVNTLSQLSVVQKNPLVKRDSSPKTYKYLFYPLPVLPFIHLECFGVCVAAFSFI